MKQKELIRICAGINNFLYVHGGGEDILSGDAVMGLLISMERELRELNPRFDIGKFEKACLTGTHYYYLIEATKYE